MNIRTATKLEKMGFDKPWLMWVKDKWKPKKTGKYVMLITSIDELDDNPADGIFVEKTYFDNAYDLSVIHCFFEGCAYVMNVSKTGEMIGQGIIDGSPFEECEWYEDGENATYERWKWTNCGHEEDKLSWYQNFVERKDDV